MAAKRGEPFLLALAELRRRLGEGRYPPEARLAAGDLAAELRLSATPVREALARLAGEGVLEDRRGQGFFLPRLSGRDVADLYRLGQSHLEIALKPRRTAGSIPPVLISPPADALEAVRAADRLLAGWVAGSGGRVLARSFACVQLQLAPVRALEPEHLEGLVEEWTALAAAGPEQLASIRRFFARRARIAGRLADALAGPRAGGPIAPI